MSPSRLVMTGAFAPRPRAAHGLYTGGARGYVTAHPPRPAVTGTWLPARAEREVVAVLGKLALRWGEPLDEGLGTLAARQHQQGS